MLKSVRYSSSLRYRLNGLTYLAVLTSNFTYVPAAWLDPGVPKCFMVDVEVEVEATQ